MQNFSMYPFLTPNIKLELSSVATADYTGERFYEIQESLYVKTDHYQI